MMITKVLKRSFATAGSLLTWGETTYGWGREISNDLRVPGRIENFNDVVGVCAGPYHLLFARETKQIYSVGLGANGRLGHGNTNTLEFPEEIDELSKADVKRLAAGRRHSLALTESGDVYAWGYGGRNSGIFKHFYFLRTDSPVGFGESGDELRPRLVESLK